MGFTMKPAPDPAACARRQVLAQWRRVDLHSAEKARADNAKPLSQVMPALLEKLGFDRRLSEAEVVRVWLNLVDPTIAEHAKPAGLNKGTLFVNVDSSVWLDEIVRYRRREILQRLQHAFGKELIARISFRIG
ncbi:MAG: DUF721 domain-containing protein [Pedosphaera sp.]|nr:DUF721 domain-containing protein [Pedosphaera sp.]